MANVITDVKFDFDSIAKYYDRWYQNPEGAMYDRLEKAAVKRFLPKTMQRKRLLEIGCGTGHWSRFFAECGFSVTGIDISASMLKVACGKKTYHASFQMADAHALPFKNGVFDIAAMITTLEFVHSPLSVIQDAVRCLKKPGGILIVGALNNLAEINRRRKQKGKALYDKANFFTPQTLKSALFRFGKPCITTTAFVWGWGPFLSLATLTTKIGVALWLQKGAFIVGKIKL